MNWKPFTVGIAKTNILCFLLGVFICGLIIFVLGEQHIEVRGIYLTDSTYCSVKKQYRVNCFGDTIVSKSDTSYQIPTIKIEIEDTSELYKWLDTSFTIH